MSEREQAKCREVLRNNNAPTTYHQQAMIGLDLDSPCGRFRTNQTITGSEANLNFPHVPDWTRNGAGVGVEHPLGDRCDGAVWDVCRSRGEFSRQHR
jgi:hypothetical protein